MKTNRMQLISEGDVSKSLFKLGIPMVVSMLVTALYNVVDTYFVSGLGTQQVGAVSVAFPIHGVSECVSVSRYDPEQYPFRKAGCHRGRSHRGSKGGTLP